MCDVSCWSRADPKSTGNYLVQTCENHFVWATGTAARIGGMQANTKPIRIPEPVFTMRQLPHGATCLL